MTPARVFQIVMILAATLVGFVFSSSARAQDAAEAWNKLATNKKVESILEDVVKEDGIIVKVLGSWITNKNYRDPLTGGSSDHDMKLIIGSGTSEDEAIKKWKEARDAIRTKVYKKFPDKNEAEQVLKSINLYPPEKLHKTIASKEAAVDAFKKFGAVPNLSVPTGAKLSDDAWKEMTEGLWGEGSLAWTKNYEGKGKIFSRQMVEVDGKPVSKVRIDLADISEVDDDFIPFTPEGSVNTSRQWGDKTIEALDDGDPDLVRKYIKRLERDVKKSKGFAKVGIVADDTADELMTALKYEPDILKRKGTRQQIRNLVNRRQLELNAIEEILPGSKSPHAKMLRESLENPGFFRSLTELIRPEFMSMIGKGVMAAFTALDFAEGYAEYKKSGTLGVATVIYKNANLTGCLTTEGLRMVKDSIVAQAADLDCNDLIAGVVTVRGYQGEFEGVDIDTFARQLPEYPDVGQSAEQLIFEIDQMFETDIMPEIRSSVQTALSKGDTPTVLDNELATAVLDNCLPTIKTKILKKRSEIVREKKDFLNELISELESMDCEIVVDPVEPYAGQTVNLTTRCDPDLETYLEEVAANLTAFNDKTIETLKEMEKKKEEKKEKDNKNENKNENEKENEKAKETFNTLSANLVVEYSWLIEHVKAEAKEVELSGLVPMTEHLFVKPGKYEIHGTVTVRTVGKIYQRWGEINVNREFDTTLEVAADRATLTICVNDDSEQPVAGARIKLGDEIEPVITEGDGCQKLESMKLGVYPIRIEADGFIPFDSQIDMQNPKDGQLTYPVELETILSEVVVNVKDKSGRPIEGVLVKIGEDRQAVSDADGEAFFNDVRPRPDDGYQVTATRAGYGPAEGIVKVAPTEEDETFDLPLVMKAGGVINVTVVDKRESPVVGAQIKLTDSAGKVLGEKTTDDKGVCSFDELENGVYYAAASKIGYQASEKEMETEIGPGPSETDYDRQLTLRMVGGVNVEVVVLNDRGERIGGNVSIDGGSQKNAPSGVVTFEGVSIGEEHIFSAVANCHNEATAKLNPELTPATQQVEVRLSPSVSLRVEVRDSSTNLLLKPSSTITVAGEGEPKSGTGPTRVFGGMQQGPCAVNATAEGYVPESTNVTIKAEGDCHNLTVISMDKVNASVSVAVAIEGAPELKADAIDILLSGPGGPFNAKGNSANFAGLREGSYTVTAAAGGCKPDSAVVEVAGKSSGENYPVQLTLTKPAAAEKDIATDEAQPEPDKATDVDSVNDPASEQPESPEISMAEEALDVEALEKEVGQGIDELEDDENVASETADEDLSEEELADLENDLSNELREMEKEEVSGISKKEVEQQVDEQFSKDLEGELEDMEKDERPHSKSVPGKDITSENSSTDSQPSTKNDSPADTPPSQGKPPTSTDRNDRGKRPTSKTKIPAILTAKGSVQYTMGLPAELRQYLPELGRRGVKKMEGSEYSPIVLTINTESGKVSGTWDTLYHEDVGLDLGEMSALFRIGRVTRGGKTYDLSSRATLRGSYVRGARGVEGKLSGSFKHVSPSGLGDRKTVTQHGKWQATLSPNGKIRGVLQSTQGKGTVEFTASVGSVPTAATDSTDLEGGQAFEGWSGGERNRFRAQFANGNLKVWGSAYVDELRRFGQPIQVFQATNVADYRLEVGGIENLSNAGYLIYETQQGQLKFARFGLDSTVHKGAQKVQANPQLKESGTVVSQGYKPGSLRLQSGSRAARVFWQTTNGQSYSGLIHKYKQGIVDRRQEKK